MRQTPNTKIGFNDTWLMVIGILVLGFIIPIVFFGARFGIHPYFRGIFFFTCLVTTACIWIGNRYILIWARTRYPEFEQVRQRHRIQYRV
ncbi:MAG: hypothetical protein Q8938_13985, partial [Bacteroidota bacterium]|nr:hypothetical protein [Bacteroidota bacterium]